MSTLVNGAASFTVNKKTGTVLTLYTEDKYVDTDVQFTIGVKAGSGAANSASADVDVESTDPSGGGTNISAVIGTKATSEPSSGYYIRLKASGSGSSKVTTAGWLATGALTAASTTATKYFPIAAGTATLTGTNTVTPSASVSGTNVTLSNTNNGIQVTATGGGSASASVTATTTAAGYVPNNTALDTKTVSASSTTTAASTYISGVTIPTPASGTNSFAVTVPNGNSTITFTFHVDSSGNVTID